MLCSKIPFWYSDKYIWSFLARTEQRIFPLCPSWSASNVVTPNAGTFKARDKPRAVATETLTPVKFPGPMPTPIEDTSLKSCFDELKASSIKYISRSACFFGDSSLFSANIVLPDTTAIVHCDVEVSKPKETLLGSNWSNFYHLRDVVP